MFTDEPENSAYSSFLRTMKLHYRCNQKILEKKGLYSGQPALLFLLKKHGLQSQRELAEKLNIKPSTVNVMVKRLEKSGLVTRIKDEADLRISRVLLTEEGKKIATDAIESMKEMSKSLFKNLTEQEEDDLKLLLNKINDNLMEVLDNKN